MSILGTSLQAIPSRLPLQNRYIVSLSVQRWHFTLFLSLSPSPQSWSFAVCVWFVCRANVSPTSQSTSFGIESHRIIHFDYLCTADNNGYERFTRRVWPQGWKTDACLVGNGIFVFDFIYARSWWLKFNFYFKLFYCIYRREAYLFTCALYVRVLNFVRRAFGWWFGSHCVDIRRAWAHMKLNNFQD